MDKKWYGIDIPYYSRVTIDRATKFREWLYNNDIKHETSGNDDFVHFEIFADEKQAKDINNALDTIIWFDSIKCVEE